MKMVIVMVMVLAMLVAVIAIENGDRNSAGKVDSHT